MVKYFKTQFNTSVGVAERSLGKLSVRKVTGSNPAWDFFILDFSLPSRTPQLSKAPKKIKYENDPE